MSPNDEYWNHQLPSVSQLQQPTAQQPVVPQQAVESPADSSMPAVDSAEATSMPSEQVPADTVQAFAQPTQVEAPAPAPVEEPVSTPAEQPASPAQFAPAPTAQPQYQAAASQVRAAAPQVQAPAQQMPPAASPAQPQAPYGGPAAPASAYSTAAQFQVAPVQQNKGGRGWIVAIVVVVCLFAFMAFAVHSCSNSMTDFSRFSGSGGSSLSDLDGDTVAVLTLDGTIQYDGSACSPEGFKILLDEAESNEHVKALVLRVNSGGGTATAGEEMTEYLRQFDKPVVVSSASINASAAYEISSQADYIFVAKSTEIGSIGTAMELTDLSGLMDKLGIRMETITSSGSKDSTYGYRALSDDEREYYQRMINQINEMFIENVAEGRHMDIEEVRKLATGLVFTGVDAVDNGLADKVGTLEDAEAKAAELAGITDYDTADLSFDSYDLSELAYLLGESRLSVDDVIDLLEKADQGSHLR